MFEHQSKADPSQDSRRKNNPKRMKRKKKNRERSKMQPAAKISLTTQEKSKKSPRKRHPWPTKNVSQDLLRKCEQQYWSSQQTTSHCYHSKISSGWKETCHIDPHKESKAAWSRCEKRRWKCFIENWRKSKSSSKGRGKWQQEKW